VVNYLSAENVSKSFHDRWLFRGISLGISQGEKYALVGQNGTGKTTLLKILSGELEPDTGNVVVRQGVRVGVLAQQLTVDERIAVKDVLFSQDNEIAAVVKDYEAAIRHDTAPERMQEILNRMEELHAWDYESKVNEVVSKLGVPELDVLFGTLSGGQKKRIFLSRLLLGEPDLLIMDEPTNHLDLEAIEWLESFLSAQQTTLIMVTHDRYFLDRVATEILELDRGQLYRYRGNYAFFLEKKSEREETHQAEVIKARNLLRKELEWMRRQPKARGTKAKYRVDAFHALKEKASQDLRKKGMELEIREARQGGKIMELVRVHKSYGDKEIIHDFSYVFKKKDRIGVIGSNGAGKSTFLDILTGRIKPDRGEVIPGLTTRFGYFMQDIAGLAPENRVIEEIKSVAEFITLSDGSQVSASKFLEMFLFPPEKQYNFIAKLSGGETKRLQLLKMLITNPNFLVLDEPTNDFDIDTLNVLGDFLEKFSGCLVLVSHDRYFMDQLVDQLFVIGSGTIGVFNGNYSDYREWQEAQAEPVKEQKIVETQELAPTEQQRKHSFNEKREYERLAAEIESLEQEKAALINRLTLGSDDHHKLHEWSATIQRLDNEIDSKTLRWLELAERVGG
jgi:ATP-binding cassette subfamily F protein uup